MKMIVFPFAFILIALRLPINTKSALLILRERTFITRVVRLNKKTFSLQLRKAVTLVNSFSKIELTFIVPYQSQILLDVELHSFFELGNIHRGKSVDLHPEVFKDLQAQLNQFLRGILCFGEYFEHRCQHLKLDEVIFTHALRRNVFSEAVAFLLENFGQRCLVIVLVVDGNMFLAR